jgi:ERCC4-type nuclease
MKVIIDERERDLFDQCYSIQCSQPTPTYAVISKEVLDLGDILIRTDDDKDVLLIERKSFSDLLASIKDSRYEEQSYRLLNSSGLPPHSVVYLLEGVLSQLRTPIEKKILYSSMVSLNFFKGFSVHRTSSVRETAEWVLHMADKIDREFIKGKFPYYLTQPYIRMFSKPVNENESREETNEPIPENVFEPTTSNYCTVVKKTKKENVTPENIGDIILCQIPGISSTTAMAIMEKFNGFPHFIEELNKNPDCINDLSYEKNGKLRKINKTSIENIKKYLSNKT